MFETRTAAEKRAMALNVEVANTDKDFYGAWGGTEYVDQEALRSGMLDMLDKDLEIRAPRQLEANETLFDGNLERNEYSEFFDLMGFVTPDGYIVKNGQWVNDSGELVPDTFMSHDVKLARLFNIPEDQMGVLRVRTEADRLSEVEDAIRGSCRKRRHRA